MAIEGDGDILRSKKNATRFDQPQQSRRSAPALPTHPQPRGCNRAGRYIPATIRGSRMDEYDPAPPDDDEIAEAYRLKYEDE